MELVGKKELLGGGGLVDVSLILVRYAELGLKSRPVRRRFEQVLVANMMAGLAKAGVEALVRSEQGRVFIETDKERDAVRAISRVFGVASLSVVMKTDSDMESMGKAAAELSRPILSEGRSFAVKARRVGDQAYTSMDVGREVGSAIFLANEEKMVKVDLTRPDVVFFVEVRGKVAYIFSTYIPGPGGLPLYAGQGPGSDRRREGCARGVADYEAWLPHHCGRGRREPRDQGPEKLGPRAEGRGAGRLARSR